MLSTPLAEAAAISDFVKDKTDRQIAVHGLFLIDQHISECAATWNSVKRLLQWIGGGVVLMVGDRVNETLHLGKFPELIIKALLG